MAEPQVVVANREDLWWLLAEASQLEHMIMCQYLFAEFTLKQGTEEGLTPEQTEAVERWRKLLRGIAVEEMLHLALVSNLMAAIGAAPVFGRPNFPQRSHYAMGNFVPWRESAWALLHERMAFLVDRCEHARSHDGAPDVVHAAGERAGALTDKIAAHVPDELRTPAR